MHQSLPMFFNLLLSRKKMKEEDREERRLSLYHRDSHFSPPTPHHRALMQLAVRNEWVNYCW